MRKYILILLLILFLLSSCAYTYEWHGLYCSASGYCEWMTGGGSETCSNSYRSGGVLPFLPGGETYFLMKDTCVVKKVWLY
jgi:hypothetical protein